MGTFHYPLELSASVDGPFERVEALVDTGATYTLVPAPLLTRLGVVPIDMQTFVIADGSHVERPLGEVVIRIGDRTRTSVVVFGDDTAPALLGMVTLEAFGLGIDTVREELIRVPGYLVGPRPPS